MASSGRTLPSATLSALTRSYGRAVRAWATNITLRYAMAVVFLLSAGASLLGAIGVGLAALFGWLAARYGTGTAYGLLAGFLIGLALLGALTGVLLLKRPLPPIPSPRRHLKAGGETTAALSSNLAQLRAKPTTPVIIGFTAAGLASWLAFSKLHRS
jgi:hypothetical protein